MNTDTRYFSEFRSITDVHEQFDITDADVTDAEILVADYCYGDYEGSAIVIFRRDGKLFLVEGGHCSCYGLEGQWEPDETLPGALHMMSLSGFDQGTRDAVKAIQ